MAERTIEQGHRAVAQALSIAPAETHEEPHAGIEPPMDAPAQITAIEDVTIRPITPKPTLFVEPAAEDHADMAPAAPPEKPFIPPQAERPVARPPRMPRIDELPIPAQNQIRARQAETAAAAPEKARPTLLQRLASVGLGRRDEETPTAQAPAPVPQQRVSPPMPKAPPMPPLAQQAARPEGMSEYAKRPVIQRPAPQGLDQHGRPAPVHNSVEEDQLEIPAFLRRQAN
jgi:cell division protein FtsZ